MTRRGVGCVVRPRASAIWRGHVLLVSPDAPTVYTASIVAGRIPTALSRAGWLVSQIDVQPTLESGSSSLALSSP